MAAVPRIIFGQPEFSNLKSRTNIPPKFAKRFLKWFLRDDLAEEVQGDLEEQYYSRLERTTHFRAKLNYWYQVFNYLRPFALKATKSNYLNPNFTAMFRQSILISFRNFKREKTPFIINLLGLSSGLACALLIFLWVNDERTIDKFHEKDSQLYRVMANHENTDGIETWNGTPGLLAPALKDEVHGVVYAVSGTDPNWFGEVSLGIGDRQIKAKGEFASKDFFNAFSYPLIQGERETVLADKSSIVISQSLANRLFTDKENAVGKTIEWQMREWKHEFMVSGIFKDVPANSTVQFDFILPFDYFQDELVTYPYWNNNYAITYLVLNSEVNIDAFNNKIADFVKNKNGEPNVSLFIQQYSDNYLFGNFENGKQAGGRIEYVRLFSIIAIFILIIACINFMNLSTAKATTRIKEVGVKKAIGAGRRSLVFQYLGESMMMTVLALLAAILLVHLFLPQFNGITGKNLSFEFNPNILLVLLSICFATGLIAGSYPALYLSGFNPVMILKGKLTTKLSEVRARKGLVVFQFVLSVVLIVSVLVVFKQIAYVRGKNLGFEKDNIIYIEKEGKVAENPETYLSEVRNFPGVINAAQSSFQVGKLGITYGIDWKGKDPDANIPFFEVSVGYNAIEILGLNIKEGRSFSGEFTSDSTAVIFNEAAIKIMGLNDPIGQNIDHYSGGNNIVGVVRDFNMESLYHEIKPLMFRFEPSNTNIAMIKIEAGKEQEVLGELKKFYQQYNPGYSFNYQFLDADYQALYTSEQRVSTLSKYFAGLAIIISCLGLFGLASFTAERRTKEIGIRKILGASIWRIVRLLSSDFTMMVLLSITIALPLSYWMADKWLDGFAYHIDLKWWFFVIAGLAALLISWFTVGLQTIKAARINPVESLKDE